MKTNKEVNEVSLSYLFFTFLKIGAISWGGFMALIAVVQKQLVDKDKVIKEGVILDGISLASVLPGAVAINVVTYVGYQLRGLKGALVSMLATIFPGFLMITGLGFIYAVYGELPVFNRFFMGVLPAIAAVILSVALEMAKKQIKDYKQLIIGIMSLGSLLVLHTFFATLGVICLSALTGYLLYSNQFPSTKMESAININFKGKQIFPWVGIILISVLILITLSRFLEHHSADWYQLNKKIFLSFSGMSLTLFGGGYVIIPAMQQVIVDGFHWMTTKEFSDAIAMGQITPGPVILTATFIGYKVAGVVGATIATFAIFFPPGVVMLVFSGFLSKIKNSRFINSIFAGMRPAIIGMIFSATYTVGKEAEPTVTSAFIFVTVFILLMKYKVNVIYMIPLAGIVGMMFF